MTLDDVAGLTLGQIYGDVVSRVGNLPAYAALRDFASWRSRMLRSAC